MKIIACGSVPTAIAPEKYFTGRVWQTPIIEKEAPARLRAIMVSFEPGARTHWHTHPLGQTLYVISGAGLAQSWGEPVQAFRAGDVISFAPDEKHLARRRSKIGDGAYHHAGGARRRPCRLAGNGDRRAVWRLRLLSPPNPTASRVWCSRCA